MLSVFPFLAETFFGEIPVDETLDTLYTMADGRDVVIHMAHDSFA